MKVSATGFTRDEIAVLRCLLYPYQVELSSRAEGSDLVICADDLSASSKPMIRVPKRRDPRGGYQALRSHGNGVVDLPFDLVGWCSGKFEAAMNPKVALIYRLIVTLPFRYTIFPSSIRSTFLSLHEPDKSLSDHLAMEVARKILIEAFDMIGFHLQRKNPPSLLITHDIETERGLRKALSLKAIEDHLDVCSMWFLPSHEYPIPRGIAEELADGSSIGSHDIRHDGRLILIQSHDQLVQRTRASKVKLEEIFRKEVTSFRAPLLQSNRRILASLERAGYGFDFSFPCWEPVHPVTGRGFGVELLQEFRIDGVVEIPLTLFQDHQVLNVLRMNTREATRFWCEQAKLVRSFGGDIVLLVHPDYSFSLHLDRYKELLQSLLEIQMRAPICSWA